MAATSPCARPVRSFLTYLKVEAGLAAATIDAYSADLRDLASHLGDDALASPETVDARMLADHMRWLHRERELAPSSITRHLATLRVFFRFLHANGFTEENPARLLERPHQWKRLPGVLSPKQMRLLIDAANPDAGRLWLRDRAMLELMYAAGLRASEVGRLELPEYNATLGVLLVTGKGEKQRMVPIGEPAQLAADAYLADLRPSLARFDDGRDRKRLLLSNNGRPLERVAVWQIVRKSFRLRSSLWKLNAMSTERHDGHW